jgi:hypothetical protein
VQARDAAGLILTTGGSAASLALTLFPARPSFAYSVVDNADGTYAVTYTTPTQSRLRQGGYQLTISVMVNGSPSPIASGAGGTFMVPVAPSPITLTPGAGVPVASNTRLVMAGEQPAGQLSFTLFAFDTYGNPSSDGAFTGTLVDPAGGRVTFPAAQWMQSAVGVFSLSVSDADALGTYTFRAALGTQALPLFDPAGAPLASGSVTVGAGTLSTLSVLLLPVGVVNVGSEVVAYITAYDAQANRIFRAGETSGFDLSIVGVSVRTRREEAKQHLSARLSSNDKTHTPLGSREGGPMPSI